MKIEIEIPDGADKDIQAIHIIDFGLGLSSSSRMLRANVDFIVSKHLRRIYQEDKQKLEANREEKIKKISEESETDVKNENSNL